MSLSSTDVQRAQATFPETTEMTCLGETGEAVGEAEPSFLYPHPHPVAGLQAGALARLRLPIPHVAFKS